MISVYKATKLKSLAHALAQAKAAVNYEQDQGYSERVLARLQQAYDEALAAFESAVDKVTTK